MRTVLGRVVLCVGFLREMAETLGEDQFLEGLSTLYSRDNRGGRTNGALDLYALFAEIDWPEGYYYCMDGGADARYLRLDLLRHPHSGLRYQGGRWASRGYTAEQLDGQARRAREILDGQA